MSFTIEALLAPESPPNKTSSDEIITGFKSYAWIDCSRYRPPKIDRYKRKDSEYKKRTSRNPRIPFTSNQVALLEQTFQKKQYLSSMDVSDLSNSLRLSDTRIKIWFQNRRARARRDGFNGAFTVQLMEPHDKLKSLESSTSPSSTSLMKQLAVTSASSTSSQSSYSAAMAAATAAQMAVVNQRALLASVISQPLPSNLPPPNSVLYSQQTYWRHFPPRVSVIDAASQN